MAKLLSVIALLVTTGAYAADSGQVVASWGTGPTAYNYSVDENGNRLSTDPSEDFLVARLNDDVVLTPDAARQIVLVHKITDTRALDLSVLAYDRDNPEITSIVIATDTKALIRCTTQKPCNVTWKRTDMPYSVNNLMVTITNGIGRKYGMPVQIARP